MVTVLKILLFIIGVPIVILFWIAVVFIATEAHKSKKSHSRSSRNSRTIRLDSTTSITPPPKARKRRVKQPTIMKLK